MISLHAYDSIVGVCNVTKTRREYAFDMQSDATTYNCPAGKEDRLDW